MSIREEARQAAQEYTRRHVGGMQPVETIGDRVRAAFEAGAVWRDEQADRESSVDAVEAAARAIRATVKRVALSGVEDGTHLDGVTEFVARVALLAAQEVRDAD